VATRILLEDVQITIVVSSTVNHLIRAVDKYIAMESIRHNTKTYIGALYVLFIMAINIGQGRTVRIRVVEKFRITEVNLIN
jgi:hypothetical protein